MNERNKKENRPSYRQPSFKKSKVRQAVEKKFYDNADMMQLFNVCSRTLQRWRDEGIVPYKKVGGKIYYLAQKVDDLMEAEDDEQH